ncbi:clathrin light chain B-like isoform X1 [Haliotis rufescens]|uniref:clathrin light chain B-like isoform X1 n=1 Tax=Haliotis rufescens TaxID=6454 RepID=UPI00201EDEEF|nr:clathrin light chain B-like isoform X1 [Haliotis rufescens]
MADFDNFEGANTAEEDPAAEFLAREQTELAGLEDDNFAGDSSAQPGGGDFDAFGSQATEPAAQEEEDDDVDDEFANDLFGGGQGGGFEMVGGDNSLGDGLLDMGSVEPSGGLLDMDAAPPLVNEQSAPEQSVPATNGPSDAYSAISQVDTERAEPEQIKLWREEQKNRLEKKDVEEEQKKGDWHDVARKELEDWYKHHAEQLEKAKENNRAAETAFIKERDESIPGAQWEKICRLCEFNPKNVKSTKDVSRMRSMLLQLKQTPLVR